MNRHIHHGAELPPEQQAIQDRCSHPSGTFAEFSMDDLDTSIPARFEKIVRLYPERVALKTNDETVTYAELNAHANRIARSLLAMNQEKAEVVAVMLENGVPLVATILGVLKAGKIFVPLDPTQPVRVKAIVHDVQPAVAIVSNNEELLSAVATPDCRVVQYETLIDQIPAANVLVELNRESLAVIVYTSGSTGVPKGVVWDHLCVLYWNRIRTQESEVTEEDRIAALTSHTGNWVGDTLLALLNGAALLPFDVRSHGVLGLEDWLSTERVSICAISSPLFRKLCEFLKEKENFPHLRVIRLRSDLVRPEDVSLYRRFFHSSCVCITGLASSESGLLTSYRMDHSSDLVGGEAPLGYPVAESGVFVADDSGKRVGFGEIGEIVASSRFLARGYWRQSELTQTKLRPDPEHPGQRLYFTGDLGVMRPDGCLIHKGRKDFRVKIRGHGVDLIEVETALLNHPSVDEAVIAARKDRSGETRLVGYYTSRGSADLNVTELRNFLSDKLTPYMTPSVFIRLDRLPLTANGKVDRRALPEPGIQRPALNTAFVAPRTDLETKIARIFSECTGIDGIGVDDDFFDLGGDSLLLARLVSRLGTVFQCDIAVGELFGRASVAVIARQLGESTTAKRPRDDISRAAAAENVPTPLSFAQQRLWFLDQLNPGDPAYNLLAAFQISGPLHVAALERSFNEIIARHEVLRTVFDSLDGQPTPRVLANVEFALQVVDLGELQSGTDDNSVLQRHCAALARQPFDLSRGPLLRAKLLRRSEGDHVLLLAVHHIVFDGWSMGVLWQELSACYEALCAGEPMSLPDPPIQYADYARWQKNRVEPALIQEHLDYWRKQLDGIASPPLPADHPRPPNQSSHGAKRYFTISENVFDKLKRLSHDQGATLFMTLLAAFQILLHRYTAQNDIAIGCPVAGRNRSELENLIGFFLNILVFRVDTSGAPSFVELLERVRQVCFAAYAHQDLPFERLVEELNPERHLNGNPLVDVMFAFQNTPQVAPQLCGASVSQLDIDSGISRFALQLFVEECDGQLRGDFSYSTDLFGEATIARMAQQFTNLIEGIVADPKQRITDLPLLGEAEKHQLLVEWNSTHQDYPADKCIHQLFEEQLEHTPESVAVIFEERCLTYRELNHRANQLAHYLRKLGVGPEVLVGICTERSLEMIVGLLGILKAGGAYLPLDSSQPSERLEFMLQDSRAALLLTQANFEDRFNGFGGKRICLDRDWQEIERESEAQPISTANAQNLAYVIYTSGSTGRPKGVAIEHGNTISFLAWAQSAFSKDDLSGVLASTSIGFDLSVFEIFAPLTCGGTVIVAENSLALATLAAASKVSLINTVPSALDELLNLAAIPPSVRVINLAGESLQSQLVRRIYESTSVLKVHDLYGPSECTTYSTWMRRTTDGPQSIGRPIANTQVYILGPHRNPVPIGVIGEIYIGGDGVARGYLNRPELTAERFIEHSFDGEPARRLYRTGDLARYLADGNIEFCGRLDEQVKLRGYRIELGEIEAVLGQHRAVQSSVVVVREDEPGDKRMVAYVVTRSEASFDAAEVRKCLKQKLPEYMIPAAFVLMEKLPLMPNGKVNRRALPAPDPIRPALKETFVGPRSSIEAIVSNIWAEVLRVERVGVFDNFFELGGHSLLATQVISRIRDRLQNDLPLRVIFESPTVAEMATVLVTDHSRRLGADELAKMLREVEAMSEKEAEKRLANDRARR